jgi:hypothetical protein
MFRIGSQRLAPGHRTVTREVKPSAVARERRTNPRLDASRARPPRPAQPLAQRPARCGSRCAIRNGAGLGDCSGLSCSPRTRRTRCPVRQANRGRPGESRRYRAANPDTARPTWEGAPGSPRRFLHRGCSCDERRSRLARGDLRRSRRFHPSQARLVAAWLRALARGTPARPRKLPPTVRPARRPSAAPRRPRQPRRPGPVEPAPVVKTQSKWRLPEALLPSTVTR